VKFVIKNPTPIPPGWEDSRWANSPPTFKDVMVDIASAANANDLVVYDIVKDTAEIPN
jgi:hypothetical protein